MTTLQSSSSKLYYVGFYKKTSNQTIKTKKSTKGKLTSSKSLEGMKDNLEEVMPKKPNEIFEIRMKKITSDNSQSFIVLEIIEQS
jgi:hypothetical protein